MWTLAPLILQIFLIVFSGWKSDPSVQLPGGNTPLHYRQPGIQAPETHRLALTGQKDIQYCATQVFVWEADTSTSWTLGRTVWGSSDTNSQSGQGEVRAVSSCNNIRDTTIRSTVFPARIFFKSSAWFARMPVSQRISSPCNYFS